MEPYCRASEKDTSYRNETLSKTFGYLFQGSCYERRSEEQHQASFGLYKDLITTVRKRKLRWYGYKTRLTGLAKMILQGTVHGERRKGRQKKRWEDITPEWTGLGLGEAL